MAEDNSTSMTSINSSNEAIDALDGLNHAYAMTEFLQGVLTLKGTSGITMHPEETTGLYFIFNDIKDRLSRAIKVMEA